MKERKTRIFLCLKQSDLGAVLHWARIPVSRPHVGLTLAKITGREFIVFPRAMEFVGH